MTTTSVDMTAVGIDKRRPEMPATKTISTDEADIAIVGGGLHGCSIALQLARRGKRVVVFEKDHPGRHASGVNAGGIRRLGRHPAEIPLAEASLAMWRQIEPLVGDDCGFHAVGQLKIAESNADMEILTARAEQVRALGFTHEQMIGRNRLREIVPDVAPHCVGGLWCEGDGAADPFRTTAAFARAAAAAGARFRIGERVMAVNRSRGAWQIETDAGTCHAGVLVNAAGAWGGEIAKMLGDTAPVVPTALMMMVTSKTNKFLTPVCGLASRKLSFKQTPEGTLLIGGGHVGRISHDGECAIPDPKKFGLSARTVIDVFPHLRNLTVNRTWAGIEGVMPDQLPVIGPAANADVAFHAFGFSAHGFQLAPITGTIIADLICAERSPLPISSFDVGRFASNTNR